MKTYFAVLQSQGQKQIQILVLFLLAFQLGISSCTSIEKEPSILPNDPFEQPITKLNLVSDSNRFARLPLKSLNLNRAKAFSFSTRDFKHGAFELEGDSALVFVPTETKNWKLDSGYVIVTQSGKKKEGAVLIVNNSFKPIIINPEPEPEPPIVWLKGSRLPDMDKVVLQLGLNGLKNFDSTILKGMEEPGSEVDSVWGFIHSAAKSNDKKKINYLAQGGKSNFRTFGTDHIYYRIKRPNGLFWRGMIPIVFIDTAQPGAIDDERIVPPTGGFVLESSLLQNDKGTNPVLPRTPKLKLYDPIEFVERPSIKTQFGLLKDSTQNGNKAFYYKRTRAGNQADTSFIFLEEGPQSRITRSRLIIKQ